MSALNASTAPNCIFEPRKVAVWTDYINGGGKVVRRYCEILEEGYAYVKLRFESSPELLVVSEIAELGFIFFGKFV